MDSWPPPSSAECRAAADSLAHGSHATATWGILIACPAEAPAAITTAIGASHAETDTIFLGMLGGLANRTRTPGVLRAALELNRDKSATHVARVVSFDMLLGQYSAGLTFRPLTMSWTTLLNVPRGESCQISGPAGGG